MPIAPDAVLKSLADPTRRAIFERLSRDGEQTVRMLTDNSGVSQPALSKHPGVLKAAGLVHSQHQGRETHYRARPRGLAPVVNYMSFYRSFWRERFERLEDRLKRMDQ